MEERPQEPPARPAVPWSALHLLLVLFVSLALEEAAYLLLGQLGWFEWFYGVDWAALARPVAPGDTEGLVLRGRTRLWAGVVAFPLKVAGAVALIKGTTGASLADLGLTLDRLGRNVLLGLLLALALTPGAYAINALMVLLIEDLGGGQQPHFFTRLIEQGPQPVEWVLLVFSAVVIAAVWEELFYRGLVQPWVVDRQMAGGAAALSLALLITAGAALDVIQRRQLPRLVDLLPLIFLVGLAGAWALLGRRSGALAGVLAVAVLFGWAHMSAWPAPVPLVWLAAGLGWLALRTRSLAGPVALHAAFNGVACAWAILKATGAL